MIITRSSLRITLGGGGD